MLDRVYPDALIDVVDARCLAIGHRSGPDSLSQLAKPAWPSGVARARRVLADSISEQLASQESIANADTMPALNGAVRRTARHLMKVLFETKKVQKTGRIALNEQLLRNAGLQEGDAVAVYFDAVSRRIILERAPDTPEGDAPVAAAKLTKKAQA